MCETVIFRQLVFEQYEYHTLFLPTCSLFPREQAHQVSTQGPPTIPRKVWLG